MVLIFSSFIKLPSQPHYYIYPRKIKNVKSTKENYIYPTSKKNCNFSRNKKKHNGEFIDETIKKIIAFFILYKFYN